VDREARRHINNSRFRPIIENGQFVPAVRTFTLEYRYDEREVED
jgi:hypothetical protein